MDAVSVAKQPQSLWFSPKCLDRNSYMCVVFLAMNIIMANREALKKPVRSPPIRNAHICPRDSAGYYNELLCTNSHTHYIYGLDECVGRL